MIGQLLDRHMVCSVRTNLSLKNTFLLKWYIPAIMALRLKLPAIRDREAEIVIRHSKA